MDSELLAKLREPFPPEAIGQIPRGGVQLDYVGHAHVTERLNEVDPDWTWRPMGVDANGLPIVDMIDGVPRGFWIYVTVGDKTLPAYGSVDTNAFEPIKELIGDALRNGAMRFGVALDLWMRESSSGRPPQRPEAADPLAQRKALATTAAQSLDDADRSALKEWMAAEDIPYPAQCDAKQLAAFEQQLATYEDVEF